MIKNKIIALAAATSVIFANEALAEKSYDERVYIAPSVSYLWLDDDRLTSRSGHGLNLGLGKAINKNTNLEVKALYNRYQHQRDASRANKYQWDSYGATFDVQYYFSRDKIAPYAVAGAGFMNSKVGESDALGIIGEAGLGLAYKISKNLSLRSDVRYRYNNNFNKVLTSGNRDRFNDLVVNVGFVIPLGQEPKPVPTPKPIKKPVVKINPDLDGDGVKNEYDKCPNTIKGSVIDDKGCKMERVTLRGVTFNSSSDVLTDEAKLVLDNLAAKLNKYPKKDQIEIQGHTDSTGSAEFNLSLSQKRAQAVVTYLQEKDVSNKINAVGYGETHPIAKNSTKTGRLANRRVELVWK